MPAFKACAHAMTTARNWVNKVQSRADLLPHGDVGTPERVQSEVAFAGCQAARYSVHIGSRLGGPHRRRA
jgi:hypothetical protein